MKLLNCPVWAPPWDPPISSSPMLGLQVVLHSQMTGLLSVGQWNRSLKFCVRLWDTKRAGQDSLGRAWEGMMIPGRMFCFCKQSIAIEVWAFPGSSCSEQRIGQEHPQKILWGFNALKVGKEVSSPRKLWTKGRKWLGRGDDTGWHGTENSGSKVGKEEA